MTPPDAAIAGPEVCPYLGLFDDPRSRFTFPTPGHRCHAKANPAPIEPEYQSSYCLSTRYPECERFRSAKKAVRPGSDSPVAASLTAPVATATMVSAAADTGPSRNGGAGWGWVLVRFVAALALLALAVAIGVGAFGKSPANGVAPGGVASPSATATPALTPAASLSPTVSAAPTNTPAPTPIIHVVAPGETLSSIALLYGVTVQAIQDANKIADPSRIKAGQQLIIPAKP